MASVSSPWIPEDDLLLKNSIEAGASLEALAKGAVKFSRRFTFRELRDRWHSLLYDPDVSAQASAQMAEFELSASNPSSKFGRLDILKGSEKASEKRKSGSIRRQYYAMRKRIKNEFFNSPNLGFFEERNLHNYSQPEHNFQGHGTTNHEAQGGDAIGDCLANNLGFEETDFEILRQAFPESIGSIATTTTAIATTTTTTTAVVENPTNAFHMEGCDKSVQNDRINGSTREDGLYKFSEDGSFDPNIKMKNATQTLPNGKLSKTDEPEATKLVPAHDSVGGKQHFSSPVSDGSASFHTMGFSSPSTRLPLWKTMEDVSAPNMPVDENNAESHQIAEESLAPPEDHDHRRESSPGYDATHSVSLLEDRPIHEGEYTDLPDSLLNFSNEDDILFMDIDAKDTNLLGSHKDAREHGLCNVDSTTSLVARPNLAIPAARCAEESKDSFFHGDDACPEEPKDSLQLTEGKIICTLNREDPDIPCNDDIFLLIHPSTSFPPSAGLKIAMGSIGPLSSSHENNGDQGLKTLRKGKELAPCFTRAQMVGPNVSPEFVSARPLVGSAFKRDPPDAENMVPLPGKPNNLRVLSQSRSMHKPLEVTGNGVLEEAASKAELRGLDTPAIYSEMPLEGGSTKMTGPESMDDSRLPDQNDSDGDDDIPYFSDVEAMILEMDLAHAEDSCFTSEVARYQNEVAKKMIIRLEQAARSSLQRVMSSQGALAIFYGRHLKHYIKKTEVTIGRSTDDTEVDIDLRKEGRANKISRRQAIIKMETDGSFNLKNLGSSSISLNGKEIIHRQVAALTSSCLIEIRGMSFVFEINDKYVRRVLDNEPK